MKKILLTLFLIISINVVKGQTKTNYIEFNAGISTGTIPFFPGGSLLYGKNITYNSGIVLDYEGGVAFPSVITGKIGVGYSFNDESKLTVGIRPWPSTSYLQLELNRSSKMSNIILSVERMWGRDLFIQDGIFTIGWRFNGLKYGQLKTIKH